MIDLLSPRVLRRIEQLSRRTGKTPDEIVDAVIELYELSFVRADLPEEERERRLLANPLSEKIFSDRLSLLNRQAAKNIAPEDLIKRASAGGEARAASLGKRARRLIAKKAAKARWNPPTENK